MAFVKILPPLSTIEDVIAYKKLHNCSLAEAYRALGGGYRSIIIEKPNDELYGHQRVSREGIPSRTQ